MYSIKCFRKCSIVVNSRRTDKAIFYNKRVHMVNPKFFKEFETLSEVAEYICRSHEHLFYVIDNISKQEMNILQSKIRSISNCKLRKRNSNCYELVKSLDN